MKLSTEPALWVGVIKLAILCGVAFGLSVSEVQLVALVALLEGIGGLIIRSATVTVQTVEDAGTTKKALVDKANE